MHRVAVRVAAVAVVGTEPAEAHVGHRDGTPLRRGQRVDEVDPADHVGRGAGAAVVEHANGPELSFGGDTDHADAVVDRADDPGDVSAVAIAIVVVLLSSRGAVGPAHDVGGQVGVVDVDAGIDHRDIHARPLVRLVLRVDAVHARADRLVGPLNLSVGRQEPDLRIGPQGGDAI